MLRVLSTTQSLRRIATSTIVSLAAAVVVGGCGRQPEPASPPQGRSSSAPGAPDEPHVYVHTEKGTWARKSVERQEQRLIIRLRPDEMPHGECLLVVGKPPWMVLEDVTAPVLVRALVDGKEAPTPVDGVLDLGCFSDDRLELVLEFEDNANPISDAVEFGPGARDGFRAVLNTSRLGPPSTAGQLGITLLDLEARCHDISLVVRDMAPLSNAADWRLRFCVMGVTVREDRQVITLAGAGADYRLQPDISRQIILPGGVPFKLTTNLAGKWYYPREFAEVQVMRETAEEQTVRARATVQGLDGKPFEGFGEIEYELTVRTDTPCLLVTTRAFNRSAESATLRCNWGWLPGEYYVTPAGRQPWQSAESGKYENIGRIGWLWLAPSAEGRPGLVWVSNLMFGESRFATMLLYSDSVTAEPGGFVEMRFAIGPADNPEQARTIAENIVMKGLVEAPPAQSANP